VAIVPSFAIFLTEILMNMLLTHLSRRPETAFLSFDIVAMGFIYTRRTAGHVQP
jgi:hypothetical protein